MKSRNAYRAYQGRTSAPAEVQPGQVVFYRDYQKGQDRVGRVQRILSRGTRKGFVVVRPVAGPKGERVVDPRHVDGAPTRAERGAA